MSTHQLPTATSLEPLAQHLVKVTVNLGQYVEEQAQMIAKPRIEAAKRDLQDRLDEMQRVHAISEQRSADLIAELRRQVAGLDRFREKALLREKRVRAVADDLDARDLRQAATDVRNALRFVGHMKGGVV